MSNFDIPTGLEPYRDELEKTLRPYVKITTEIAEDKSLRQSKFLGKPYLPKSMELPKTPAGESMYLLAQINFAKIPPLKQFPKKGILQFYLSKTELYGADFEQPTTPNGFSVLYHPEPNLAESDLTTNFDHMPSPWDEDDRDMPFIVYSKYEEKRNSCFLLTFETAIAPISPSHYQFLEKTGIDLFAPYRKEKEETLSEQLEIAITDYYKHFEGHRLGGYPGFTQTDPREYRPQPKEPYKLLLQIDTEITNKIDILWGDMGTANFFIQSSALERLDFSNVWYNWDCG